MCKVKLIKLAGLMSVMLAFVLLYGCSKSPDKTPSGEKVPESGESEIAKLENIEVRINIKPAGLSIKEGVKLCDEFSYEGKVTNTGFQIAPVVEVNLSWENDLKDESMRYKASSTEKFRNLRPGETREFSGVLYIVGANDLAMRKKAEYGGIFLFIAESPLNEPKYDVKVYREE